MNVQHFIGFTRLNRAEVVASVVLGKISLLHRSRAGGGGDSLSRCRVSPEQMYRRVYGRRRPEGISREETRRRKNERLKKKEEKNRLPGERSGQL